LRGTPSKVYNVRTSMFALVRRTAKIFFGLYMGIALLSLVYRVNQTNEGPSDQWGLLGWAVTGKASSATKSLLWPYFLYSEYYSEDAPLKRELWRILPALKAASAFNAQIKTIGSNPSREQLLRLLALRDPIVAVEPIDVVVLDRLHPNYGYMVRDKLFASIKLVLDTSQKDRVQVRDRANKMIAEWNQWYDPRFEQIHSRVKVLARD
jgi:hypothetical protein